MRARAERARALALAPLLFAALLAAGDRAPAAAGARADEQGRIRFRITGVEERGGERRVISEATVEGPPGTDFNVSLEGGRFRLVARFLTEPVRPGALLFRAKIDTRRLYGRSGRGLPLYEEDRQEQSLEVGFEEAVVLLPFGGGDGGGDRLKIEITPEEGGHATARTQGTARPPEIRIVKVSPGGLIRIEASRVPHRYVVDAALVEDGREVARGSSPLLLEEPAEFALAPVAGAGADVATRPPALRFTVERYMSASPSDLVAVGFDVYRAGAAGARETVGRNWAGVTALGEPMVYDLPDYLPGGGRKYQLRLGVRLAGGAPAGGAGR